MRAVVRDRYGPPDVLRLQELPTPAPADGEVRVRVRAAAVAAGDWHLLRGSPFLVRLAMGGILRPPFPVLGADMAGVVDAVGPGVAALRPGDEVVGHLSECGFGAFAEAVVAPEEWLVPKPQGLSWEEAAALPGSGLAALQGLRLGGVRDGARVLVNGASGGVGSAAVQIAVAAGAEVTGVCSTRNVEMVRALGAARVVDYTREDYTRGEARYDLVLDAAAFRSVLEARRVVAPDGAYVMVGGATRRLLQTGLLGPLLSREGRPKMKVLMTEPTRADLLTLVEMAGAGSLRPVLDRSWPLEDAAAALAHVEAGHARGKVVLEVG